VMTIDARVRLPSDLRPSLDTSPNPELESRYDALFGLGESRHSSSAKLLADLESAGVSSAVVHAEYESGDGVDALNEATAKFIEGTPVIASGLGTISLVDLQVMRVVRQVQQVADLGLAGINIQPAFFDLAITDPRLYPVYAACAERDLIVAIHTGINYTSTKPMAPEQPIYLDQIACHFPGLRLIACHGGWPWIAEMVAVARRHPTVYIDFGGLSPRYVGASGSGWETLAHFMNNVLSDQILYATDWPVYDPAKAIEEWSELGLKPAVLTKLLGGNAAALFSITNGEYGVS